MPIPSGARICGFLTDESELASGTWLAVLELKVIRFLSKRKQKLVDLNFKWAMSG